MDLVLPILLIVLGLLLWIVVRQTRLEGRLERLAAGPDAAPLTLLQREIHAVREGMDHRWVEQLNQAKDLVERLARLEAATDKMERLGREIAELQKVLRPPQLRGGFGERMLTDLLADMLPRDRFRTQYIYPKTGVRVDAAILLADERILPIDAKFPLDNFRRYLELRDRGDPEAESARRALLRDVRRHIDDIAQRYLSPDDGAVDLALMYIPSESVYYEVAIRGFEDEHEPIIGYAQAQRVVPVSPHTIHAYLSLILTGLRGLRLGESAREFLGHLAQLRTDVGELRRELNTSATQARHSLKNLEEADRALRRVEDRLEAAEGLLQRESGPAAAGGKSDRSAE